jgi:hypothetical protein
VSDELRVAVPPDLVEAIARLAADLVLAELEPPTEAAPWLTVADYAREHRTTPEAVRARIRRGALEARKPPGAREWLIPNSAQAGGHGARLAAHSKSAPAPQQRSGA